MLGERLKELRFKKKRITQVALSEALGVSQQTIGNWETNKAEPKLEMLKVIADYFEVTTDYLLGRDDEENEFALSEEQAKFLFYFDELDTANKQKVFGYMEGLIYEERNLRKIKSSTSKIFLNHPKLRMRG